MLRNDGRIAELPDLHAGTPAHSGPPTPRSVRAMQELEYLVLVVPELSPDVYELAATRVEWVLDNDEFAGADGALRLAAMRHTLAVARLQQGRFEEVAPLCADSLSNARGTGPQRATVLATMVLARRGLRQPHDGLLARAVSLDPDADLVREAMGETA
jgi:hypothetical protein